MSVSSSLSRIALVAVVCLGSSACIPSNVVAPEARDVKLAAAKDLTWRAAQPADLSGFFASTRIEGASAGALLRAYYYFDTSGHYSGAALVVGEEGPRFMVIADDGRYRLEADGLDLGDGGDPVEAKAAPDHLRLVTPESAITFRRVPLE